MKAQPLAFFLPSLRAGGAERVTLNLVRGIAERGRSVDLVLAAAEGAFVDQVPPSVRVVDLHAPRMLRSLAPLTGYLRRERPKALVSAMSHTNVVSLWAAKLAGGATPVLVTIHTTHSQGTRHPGLTHRVQPRLMRIFYPWASRIIAVSGGVADDVARSTGVPRERVEVIYNPVISRSTLTRACEDPDHPWLVPGQPPVILGAGRLTAAKDFPTLIRAFAAFRREHQARLMILGEGETRAELTALARELGISDDVALPGLHPNALACMARSALFVLSSAWEGLPTVLIEALAVGTRVVSTDCHSGPREILQNGRLGPLVPVGDPAALAAAIAEVMQRPPAPVPPGALAPYTMDAAVDHYLHVIDNA